MLADFAITAENPDEQYWYDAQVAAGVSSLKIYSRLQTFGTILHKSQKYRTLNNKFILLGIRPIQ